MFHERTEKVACLRSPCSLLEPSSLLKCLEHVCVPSCQWPQVTAAFLLGNPTGQTQACDVSARDANNIKSLKERDRERERERESFSVCRISLFDHLHGSSMIKPSSPCHRHLWLVKVFGLKVELQHTAVRWQDPTGRWPGLAVACWMKGAMSKPTHGKRTSLFYCLISVETLWSSRSVARWYQIINCLYMYACAYRYRWYVCLSFECGWIRIRCAMNASIKELFIMNWMMKTSVCPGCFHNSPVAKFCVRGTCV